ncbi:ATP synthase F1 subunit epsilon [Oceanotoga sp. DSM 15011]|jgi:F-type H+-transporting ATPase subunit epsilon|uniref:ATP synthase epsilon chain n=1 Tax=Oceanotoga teriensis TaxID=515440 RepID=A0AA45HIY3_9BACT|nr:MULTISPECIES: ATP synthase F1 subunit epsilon [Oceanotoga]MDO7976707.1 ATP synthase F1 subunit epsilon [Oceanotoga teriensis]PWJ95228.1 F-type H+-transporting ATPase subunit epsilon [Oceanotoga teriensis]UYP00645.1 ATP synthase F1 subunit epsilon [Oceanotoga sp. DSM 15011]
MFNVKIVTPEGIKEDIDARYVEFTTIDGSIGVLQDRLPIVAKLKFAPLKIISKDEKKLVYAVLGGLVDMDGKNFTVLTTEALKPDEIDVESARKAVEKAEEQLKKSDDFMQKTKLKSEIQRNMTKIDIANTK